MTMGFMKFLATYGNGLMIGIAVYYKFCKENSITNNPKGAEVVFIALEENKNDFSKFSISFPFPCYSDLKKWEGKIVKDYYVFSTPTPFFAPICLCQSI